MLLWMIFNGDIAPYFLEGRSVATVRSFSIVMDALQREAFGPDREKLIRERFSPDMAEKLLSTNPEDEYTEVAHEWGRDEEPKQVASGFFVYASSINWEDGIVKATIYYSTKKDDELFWDRDSFFASELTDPDYEVTLKGLCFERDAIEMLQPHIELAEPSRALRDERPRLGRPRTWDWEGATAHLIAIAQTPDGLPMGPGAQAQIERLVADWFMSSTGNTPAVSQVRQHATKIMKALKRPKSP